MVMRANPRSSLGAWASTLSEAAFARRRGRRIVSSLALPRASTSRSRPSSRLRSEWVGEYGSPKPAFG